MADTFLLVTTIKNEGPNILEWVAYHKFIGFDRIQIYQNDSSDETQKHLRTLERIGAIEYFPNPSRKRQWQNKAYRRASQSESYRDSNWCMALDGDEFLHVKVGDGTVADLVEACGSPDEILVNWRFYGNSGALDLSDELVTARYCQTEKDSDIANIQRGYKALFRTASYRRPGIHRAKVPLVETPVIANGSGQRLPAGEPKSWRTVDPECRKLAQVNHYAVRDASSFLLKSDRGSASHPDRDVALRYWNLNNFNDVEDTSLRSKKEQIWEIMKELDAQSRGRLMFLRENSLRLWKERLEQLLEDPAYAALYRELADSR